MNVLFVSQCIVGTLKCIKIGDI
ncbi:hypothetical protein KUCAC02_007925 [Chaenocephalus aceratus]|uniref:Uncharacterized protein n=1 Tax=Chaenocephalus aceratus TaxID=36190 RepID=A0ACB9X8Q2_CHAAC|nr:hypothetical protein KUCAC02_007925 [Chaenocephalus aceratus]